MCEFFSVISDGNGKPYYFNWKQRKQIMANDAEFSKVESADSHSGIASYYKLKCDDVNKYEYNPLLRKFTIDQINTTDDKCLIEEFCRELDFKTIVEPLQIKKIYHPFNDHPKVRKVTRGDIELLKQWASVGDSVWASVGASVGASVWDSVWDSVWASVGASVRDSVRDSVWASVGASVGASVRDSVRDSVWDSVGASVWASVGDSVRTYISSFVKCDYKYDFTPAIKLWERGLVPSFDGTTWRLHSGKDAKIVYEWKK
jgi:hypothetical protein